MTAPQGFAPVFKGWNVWRVWQADDPTFSVMNVGLTLERQLRIWVENEVKDNAHGASVADPLNPAALRGDQVEPIPAVASLQVASDRSSIPELAGALTVGSSGSGATLRTVRFFNRGEEAVMPWPHDENYVLEAVLQPDAANAITNGPAPSSLAGAASEASETAITVVKVVGVVLGVTALGMLLLKLADTRRAMQ